MARKAFRKKRFRAHVEEEGEDRVEPVLVDLPVGVPENAVPGNPVGTYDYYDDNKR